MRNPFFWLRRIPGDGDLVGRWTAIGMALWALTLVSGFFQGTGWVSYAMVGLVGAWLAGSMYALHNYR